MRPGTRLTLVISSLQAGGAERVLSRMANYWAAEGRAITLLSFDAPDAQPFYPLHPGVELHGLGFLRESHSTLAAVTNTFWRARNLRIALAKSQPDRVLSFLDQVNVLTLIAARRLHVPVVVSERSDPTHCPLNGRWRQLRKWTYPYARAVVVQTPEAAAYFTSPRVRTAIVPNIVWPPSAVVDPDRYTAADDEEPRWIIAVGRLGPEKGFDLLLAAFARIAARHPRWNLRIVGDGDLREALERQTRDLGLTDRVQFTGRVQDVGARLATSDIFVMSSRFEGFPNALGEAMAAGLAVVAFDCPSGPRALIRHGVDGLLVPPENVPALAETLDGLISAPNQRAALAARASDIVERFSEPAIMQRWEDLLA